MDLEYIKSTSRKLKQLGFDERWLQRKIEEDTTILGLGDLTVIERERSQNSGGRIDFLLYDPEEGTRYEVEVMLGKLDASHIIRTIEYWDIERRRYPNIEHRAVIVAEEITNRFFNVISLFNQFIPIIALQLSAFKVENKVILNFVKVLDVSEQGVDDTESVSEQVDRSHWEKISNPKAINVIDEIVKLIQTSSEDIRVTYNKNHIALGTTGTNFAWFHPRKTASHCFIDFKIDSDQRAEFIQQMEEAGINAGTRRKNMKVRLNSKEIGQNIDLIQGIVNYCEQYSRQ
ncbi:MAG: hypothetical protein AB2792_09645 [Candidatus Thiodiazotropha sp.]